MVSEVSESESLPLKRECDEQNHQNKRLKSEVLSALSEIISPTESDVAKDSESADTHRYPSKKKYAIMMGFCGEGYRGMAINVGVRTIEEELIKSLVKCKFIKPENAKELKKINFQRASRTDKGVSGARQVVSTKLNLPEDVESSICELNKALPDDIIVYDMIKATKNFDSHKFASSRVYEYNCPTFAMAPTLGDTWSGYRIPQVVLEKVRTVLQTFVGTKFFYNYTANKSAEDPSCFRHIKSITVSEPILVEDIEYIKIFLHGDSFVYHQIRKIVGMTIALLRNVTPSDYLERSFEKERLDVPLAPGLGLVLDKVNMDRYNKRFGSDGCHSPLVWEPYEEKVQNFKRNKILNIIHKKEKAESSMFIWLQTLSKHKFYTGDVLPEVLLETPLDKTIPKLLETHKELSDSDKTDEGSNNNDSLNS